MLSWAAKQSRQKCTGFKNKQTVTISVNHVQINKVKWGTEPGTGTGRRSPPRRRGSCTPPSPSRSCRCTRRPGCAASCTPSTASTWPAWSACGGQTSGSGTRDTRGWCSPTRGRLQVRGGHGAAVVEVLVLEEDVQGRGGPRVEHLAGHRPSRWVWLQY